MHRRRTDRRWFTALPTASMARHAGVISRVLLVLVLPLGLLLLTTTRQAVDSRDRAELSAQAETEITGLTVLLELRAALSAEHLRSRLHHWDADPSMLQGRLEEAVDHTDLERVRQETDDAFAAVPLAQRPFTQGDLTRFRDVFDSGATGDALSRHVVELESDLIASIAGRAGRVGQRAVQLGDQDLAQHLDALVGGIDAYLSAGQLIDRLLAVWFATPVEEAFARADLARAHDRWEVASSELRGLGSGLPVAITDGAGGRLDRVLETTLLATPEFLASGAIHNDELVASVADGLTRVDALADVVNRSAEDVREAAETSRENSAADADANVRMAVLATLLSVLTGVTSAGSIVRSLMDRDRMESQLIRQATEDSLTGVINRRSATEILDQFLQRQQRGRHVAVMFIDLDRFKLVNDTHGHGVGDELLRQVAVRLGDAVREGDIVARFGGDEFVVIGEGFASLDDAVVLGKALSEAVSLPYRIEGQDCVIGASVGVVTSDTSRHGPTLLRCADQAVYAAKAADGAVIGYSGSFRKEVEATEETERALRRAVSRDDELELWYQPVVTNAGNPVSVEALVRWHRPGHGLVMPADFVGVAEASRLVFALDEWVMRRAVAELLSLRVLTGVDDLTISVNVSGATVVDSRFPAMVRQTLENAPIAPHDLIVEVTETVLVTDLERASDHLSQVRELGVSVALDDFGAGFTSIAHLRALPVDYLKIDRELVQEVDTGSTLVPLLVDLAGRLGLRTVAEGVETAHTAEAVTSDGCDRLQGYGICRPAPLADVVDWLQNRPASDRHGAVSPDGWTVGPVR